MTIKDHLLLYIIRKSNELELENKQIQQQIRLHPMDNLDHYEVLLHRIKIDKFCKRQGKYSN